MKKSTDTAWNVKAVSKTDESISDRLKKRKDVDDLKSPFQKTTNVRLLPMRPTMPIIPVMTMPTNAWIKQGCSAISTRDTRYPQCKAATKCANTSDSQATSEVDASRPFDSNTSKESVASRGGGATDTKWPAGVICFHSTVGVRMDGINISIGPLSLH